MSEEPTIEVGDRVRFNGEYLQARDYVPRYFRYAIGIVTELRKYCNGTMATVEWEGEDDIPATTITDNLLKIHREGEPDDT